MLSRSAILGTALLVCGAVLLSVNVYGLGRSLRSPLTIAAPTDFAHQRIVSAEEAAQRLGELDPRDRVTFAMEASRIIGSAIKHEAFAEPDEPDSSEESHLRVPIWENFVLSALGVVYPSAYRAYEFVDHRKAIERATGQCGQQVLAVVDFLEEHGFNTGFVELSRHVVATAEVSPGQWYVLDPDFGLSIPHSVDELAANQALVESYYERFNVPGSDLYRYPWLVYSEQVPAVQYGGIRVRRPRGSIVEPAAYATKWGLPALLLLLGGVILRGQRGRARLSSTRGGM